MDNYLIVSIWGEIGLLSHYVSLRENKSRFLKLSEVVSDFYYYLN